MIANWDTDALQGHRKRIGAQAIMGLILMVEKPRASLSLLG